MNICLCGSQDGYPHDHCCPFPLFSEGNKNLTILWKEEFGINKTVIKRTNKLKCGSPHAGDSNCPDCP